MIIYISATRVLGFGSSLSFAPRNLSSFLSVIDRVDVGTFQRARRWGGQRTNERLKKKKTRTKNRAWRVMTGDSRLRVPSVHFVLPVCRFCIRRSSVSRLCTYGMNALLGESNPPFLSFPRQHPVHYRRPHSALSASPSTQRWTIWKTKTIVDVLSFSTTIIRHDSPNSSRKDTRF